MEGQPELLAPRARKKVDYAALDYMSDEELRLSDEEGPNQTQNTMDEDGNHRKKNKSHAKAAAVAMAMDPTATKPRGFVEKGYLYDVAIRDLYTFEPVYEADGSPSIERIVGRRPVREDVRGIMDEGEGKNKVQRRNARLNAISRANSLIAGEKNGVEGASTVIEYEYLIKFKNQSYLHTTWMSPGDIQSAGKQAKTMLNRWLKKLVGGKENPDELEDPTVDLAWVEADRVLQVKVRDEYIEMTEEEIKKWDEENKEDEEDEDGKEEGDDAEEDDEILKELKSAIGNSEKRRVERIVSKTKDPFHPINIAKDADETLRKFKHIVATKAPYEKYPESSKNPYAEGFLSGPPKRPRSAFQFFQVVTNDEYRTRFSGATQGEIHTQQNATWGLMKEEDSAIYHRLVEEESELYDIHVSLHEKSMSNISAVWQPMRRCLKVLDAICMDDMSDLFREPVDTTMFTDYLDYIDIPMDLRTVREKYDDNKYKLPEDFARDMRKVFKNCKIYNQHGTAIWYVADYMEKKFERLLGAWVMTFKEEMTYKWNVKLGRPWEDSCRISKGDEETKSTKFAVCVHCEAKCGIDKLSPKLDEVPAGDWHCERCRKLDISRLPSVNSEAPVKRKAEMREVPMKAIPTTFYLVKWKGLGYSDCTWEKKSELENDAGKEAIEAFKKEKDDAPKDLKIDKTLVAKDIEEFEKQFGRACLVEEKGKWGGGKVKGSGAGDDLKLELLSQSKALHYIKKDKDVPTKLKDFSGIGDAEKVWGKVGSKGEVKKVVDEFAVKETLDSLVDIVARCPADPWSIAKGAFFNTGINFDKEMSPEGYNELNLGEYEMCVPSTPHGVGMTFKSIQGLWMMVTGFTGKSKVTGEDIEFMKKYRDSGKVNVGDVLIGINGTSTLAKDVNTIKRMIESGEKEKGNMYLHMRFANKDTLTGNLYFTSFGYFGPLMREDIMGKLKEERINFSDNKKFILDEWAKLSTEDRLDEDAESQNDNDEPQDDDADAEVGSDEEFEMDEDELEKVDRSDYLNKTSIQKKDAQKRKDEREKQEAKEKSAKSKAERTRARNERSKRARSANDDPEVPPGVPSTVAATYNMDRRAIFDICAIDVGESSDDEDEDKADWFMGGSGAFTNAKLRDGWKEKAGEDLLPVKTKNHRFLEPLPKHISSISMTYTDPLDEKAWAKYPLDEAIVGLEKVGNDALMQERLMEANREKEKVVEQVEKETGAVIKVWASIAQASISLGIPAVRIKKIADGEVDKDGEKEETAGGFMWRYGKQLDWDGDDDDEGAVWWKKLYSHDNPRSYKGGHALRDYQIDGVNWLSSCWYKQQGSILADEMGLGKTVQIVAYLEHLWRVEKCPGPFLVVIPLSTVAHWKRELEGWTDMKYCIYHDRQREWRDVMREYEWYYEERPRTFEFLKFNVLVTTYDTLISDFDIIEEIPFRSTIVDEAHRLRNQKGKLLEVMKSLHDRAEEEYNFQHRILITGTPLQNNMDELWTLLNFVDPDVFDNQYDFDYEYGNLQDAETVANLQAIISPYMLRRVKEDVAKDIPRKEETVIDVELTSIQRLYYRAIFENNHAVLSQKTGGKTLKMQNVQMELRKCCNHPFLLEGVEVSVEEGELQKTLNGDDHGLIATSGKMVLLDKLLPKLRKEGHKVLIFSQMVRMLDVISDYCTFREFEHEMLDGRISGADRQKSIDRYNNEEDSFIFLLSTRAGGVGINLTAADTVIIFDSDWNPQNDVQAQARCHRIGQTKDVMIYRLITARSFEQEMFDRASKKLGLEQAVLGTFQAEDGDGMPSASEMEKLLKQGAYAMMNQGDGKDHDTFLKDDIDTILTRRTRTRVVEGAKNSSWLNKTGHAVNRQSFGGHKKDIDIDDPEFWNKVMPGFCNADILTRKLKDMEGDMRAEKAEKDNKVKADEEAELMKTDEGKKLLEEMEADRKAEEAKMKRMKKKTGRADSSDEEDDNGNVIDKRSEKVKEASEAFIVDAKKVIKDLVVQVELGRLGMDEMETANTLLINSSNKKKLFSDAQRDIFRVLLMELQGDRRRGKRKEDGEGGGGRGGRGGGRRKARKKYDDDDGWDEDVHDEPKRRGGKAKGEFMSKQEAEAAYGGGWAFGIGDEEKLLLDWPDLTKEVTSKVIIMTMEQLIEEDTSKTGGAFSIQMGNQQQTAQTEGGPQVLTAAKTYSTIMANISTYRRPMEVQNDLRIMYNNCLQIHGPEADLMKEQRRQMLLAVDFFKSSCSAHGLFLNPAGRPIEVFTDSEGDDDAFDSDDDEFIDDEPVRRKGRGGAGGTRMVRCRECAACRADDCGSCSACKDKPKFGGLGKLKQACRKRVCKNKRPGQGRLKKEAKEAAKVVCEPVPKQPAAPKVPGKRGRKPGSKNKKTLEKEAAAAAAAGGGAVVVKEEEGAEVKTKKRPIESTGSIDTVVVSSKRARVEGGGEGGEKSLMVGPGAQGPEGRMFDLKKLVTEKQEIDFDYEELTKWIIGIGPWEMPDALENVGGAFEEIVMIIVEKMKAVDSTRLFWKPITKSAHLDMIDTPMSLEQIVDKCKGKMYSGSQSEQLGGVFIDLLTMLANCMLCYGDEDVTGGKEVCEIAAKVFVTLPEAFASAVLSRMGEQPAREVNAMAVRGGGMSLGDMDVFTKLGRLVCVGDGRGAGRKGIFWEGKVRGIILGVGEGGKVKVGVGLDESVVEEGDLKLVA